MIGVVRTIIHGIQDCALLGEMPVKVGMHVGNISMAVESQRNTTLVGDDDGEQSRSMCGLYGICHLREHFKVLHAPSMCPAFAVHYPVTIQEQGALCHVLKAHCINEPSYGAGNDDRCECDTEKCTEIVSIVCNSVTTTLAHVPLVGQVQTAEDPGCHGDR